MMKPDSTDKKAITSEDKVRKSLHDLQSSAKDKENLVGAGRMLRSGHQITEAKTKSDTSKKKSDLSKIKATYKDKSVQTTQLEDIKIEVEDLTSTAGPSENYWKIIAERRRLALKDTLEENKELSERYEELESKYETLEIKYKKLESGYEQLEEELKMHKVMLDEARAFVEVLQDMIGDDSNGLSNSLEDSTL